MHDEQIKLKADSPKPDVLKTRNPALLHTIESSKGSKIAISLCLFIDREIPLFLLTMPRTQRLQFEADWTPHDINLVSFKESKFTLVAADLSNPLTPSHSRFSCLFFAVFVDYKVSRCMNPNFLLSAKEPDWQKQEKLCFLEAGEEIEAIF